MRNFLHKMRLLGESYKYCWDFAVIPMRMNFDLFKKDRDFAGAIWFFPAVFITLGTASLGLIAAVVCTGVIGVMGGAVALGQDLVNGVKKAGHFLKATLTTPQPNKMVSSPSHSTSLMAKQLNAKLDSPKNRDMKVEKVELKQAAIPQQMLTPYHSPSVPTYRM